MMRTHRQRDQYPDTGERLPARGQESPGLRPGPEAGTFGRPYFSPLYRGMRPAFLVLREGRDGRPEKREAESAPAGPVLIRSEEWLHAPGIAPLYARWLEESCGEDAFAALRRLSLRLRTEAAGLFESPDGAWTAVTLPVPPETDGGAEGCGELQDAVLEALFMALGDWQRAGGDSRLDLLASYPASAAEFAAVREFIETVAEQTLGHRFAAACRIGALLAPDTAASAAAEIGRIADFLVLDGAADEAAPEEAAACFAAAAEDIAAAVRRVKPAAALLAAGPPAAAALADLYRIGLSGIFCAPAQRTEALLRAACLTWIDRHERDGNGGGLAEGGRIG